MQANLCCRWLLVCCLVVSSCFLVVYARRGGGGGRVSSGRVSYSRPSPSYSRPSPSYSRPSPSYSLPSPSYSRPAPAPAPAYKPNPAPSYSQPAPKPAPQPPSQPAISRQPAYNPNFKEPNSGIETGNRQPAYNPNYKPDLSKPAGPPPPYSPASQRVPNAPVGPPPSYQSSNQPSGFYGKPPSGQPPPYPQQPPPYPGQPGRPPAYPGLSPSYAAHTGNQPYPRQPSGSYPGHPSFYQPNKPYPVQPGMSNPYPGISRPYPQQSLGGNVWQPHYGMPAPAYMNYGGIPTGTNMHTKPYKRKGFIGSLMSVGRPKSHKQNKYYGSYPSPYGIGHMGGSGMGGGFLGKHGSSAAMYTIFPYMAAKKMHKIRRPKFGYFSMYYMPRSHYYHHYHHHDFDGEINPKYARYFDVYDDNYAGKCQRPIKKKNSSIKCSTTFDELQCAAKCDEGYRFANGTASKSNKCWHVTGVWKPKKNFPDCEPVCTNECLNGGKCVAPEVCKCPAEYRGSRCQFYFLKCNILTLVKNENVGWVCRHRKNESICRVRCKDSSEFDLSSIIEYRCTPDGVWTPDTPPHCPKKEN